MGKFAKLIELENNEQVLLTVNYNHDEDNFDVSIITGLETCVAEIKLSFDSQEKAYRMLETYSHEQAVKFRDQMVAMLS